ncbi:ABC transporter ATP-binding protein [Enterococcus sp. RIT-PI-f]|uniref:ABC transporter ATP-binding protein n=1 Tax=Enterococcus sp. RIT-PI-f TaxID=1690244 RepID=UPI0006B8C087|nr:ABC transporter ATP-binding protein [Enterococcus sp. RIT-PI-f]KPG71368.1 cobalt ABC transporter [Enterococcus sp. RIT-PI-f]
MIRLANVQVIREKRAVLTDVSVMIPSGEVIVLCGASGSGKSTILNVLNGLIPELYPATVSGVIQVDDISLPVADFSAYAQKIGVVFQNPKTQFFTTDVYAELAFSMENAGIAPHLIRQRIKETAAQFAIAHLLSASVFDLSGGEQQLVALAAAAMLPHDVFLLDEPSSNLDDGALAKLVDALIALKQQGKTIVIAEHRLAYLTGLADRYCLLEEGQIKKLYPANEILSFSPQMIHDLGLRQLQEPVDFNEGGYIDTEKNEALVITGLKIKQTRKKATRPWAVSIPALTLPMKQAIGITGPNGAGKSTLVQVLSGLKKASKTAFHINGQAISQKQLLQNSFLVMQDVNLQLFFETVEKELLIKAEKQADFERIVALLDLSALLQRHPQSLSGGEKQRVAIGSALLSGKRFLFFDEPTSGLDLRQMEAVSTLLQQVAKEVDLLIVISHDQEFLRRTCPQVIRLAEGMVADDEQRSI